MERPLEHGGRSLVSDWGNLHSAVQSHSRLLRMKELLEVARDGIEPPTPAFSGPRSTS